MPNALLNTQGHKKIDYRFSKHWRLRLLRMLWSSNLQMCRILNKWLISEPALHMPDVQDPRNELPMSEPALHMPDMQDPENKLSMSPSPHTAAKRHCVSQSAAGGDAQCRFGFPRWHQGKACILQFCLQQIES